jgi:hypothetical protein
MPTANANATLPSDESRLRHFPIAFFEIVMGLAGLARTAPAISRREICVE